MLHEMLMYFRWKDKGAYDILVECAELSIDMSENAGSNSAELATTSQSALQPSLGYCWTVAVIILLLLYFIIKVILLSQAAR